MAFDPESVTAEIAGTLRVQAGADFQRIRQIVGTHAASIAAQAELLVQSRIESAAAGTGSVLDEFFADQLKVQVRHLAQTVAAMTVLTLEKAWNAMVGIVWTAMNAALSGAGLPGLPIPH
ncbi:hypothetical protein [Mangrovicoccus sp. HB161399]|uniref:hypothetical protein n=1 Tax=Mangrovicoccus sp. HB161399 TaxID=2720392 RepID=UPI0015578002|nr:hypothetical protein [Mangrovicoccus sp. HB161399]